VLFLAAGPLVTGCGSETCVTKVAVYDDADGDGYGFGEDVGKGCPEAPGEGHASNNRDCNDGDDTVFPGADEVCDFVDNDCDGGIDESLRKTSWYADGDADGFGGGESTSACAAPGLDWAPEPGDCDDSNPLVNPNGIEICNEGIDDDCNGAADDDDFTVDPTTYLHWYLDGDGDTFGDRDVFEEACQAPTPESILDGTDCDDLDATISPAAIEICDTIDNDCDDLIDDADPSIDPATQFPFFADADGDSYGDPLVITLACDSIAGYGVDNDDDCDDSDPAVTIPTNWLYDVDVDGFGGGAPVGAFGCFPPEAGTVGEVFGIDCDDADPLVNPDAIEVCGDDIDNDCVGGDKSCGPIGQFQIFNGPPWVNDPPVYSCIEACALLFGGVDTDYHCSTSGAVLDYQAYVDGWGDSTFCFQPVSETFQKEQAGNPGYNCGAGACSYSAYVMDHACMSTNYCWES
jgi:hypothetical protein